MAASGAAPGWVADESLRQLLEDFPGLVWILDRELRVREVYGADLESLGLTLETIRARRLEEIVGESGPDAVSAHREALAGRNAGYEFMFRGRRRRSRIRPLRGPSGQVEGVVGVSVDVSELQEAEHRLAEFGAIVQSSSDAIIGKTLDGTVTSWNRGAEGIYGYTADEIIGRSIATIIPPELEPELGPILARAARGESTQNLITTRRRKDGVRITVALTVSPIFARDGTVTGASTIARDITEDLRVQAALHTSEAVATSVIDSALDAIVMMDADGRIVEFNPAAVAMFGHERAHAIGREMATLIVPPALRDAHRAGLVRYRETGEGRILGRRLELTGLRADGSEFPIELTILLVADSEPPLFTGFVRDITDRKNTEANLLRLAAIVEASDDAIFTRSLDRIVLTWNPGAERLFGYAAEEIVGRSVDLLMPEGAQADVHRLRERIDAGEHLTVNTTMRRRDGTEIAVSSAIAPIADASGATIAVAAIVRDVTPLIAAQEALARSEETYRLLFEQHPSPIWLFDPDTLRFLAVNESAIATYGYDRDEFLGMTIEDIRPEEDREALHAAISNPERGRGLPVVGRHRKKDGTLIDVEVESNWIDFQGRRARLVLAQDVTEQRRLETQLRQSQKMEAIGSLAGGVAHDFNNVLLVIRGLSGLLANQLDGEARERALEIDLAAQRAAEVTQQLLAFSRQQVLRPEVVDLTVVLEETLSLLRRLIGENVEIATALAPDLPPILIDRSQLQQVILNLLVNARDAMAARGGVLTVRTGVVELDDTYAATAIDVTPGHYVVLEVTDTGAGMDEETRLRIFDPFFTTKDMGTGLGLATVFGIVKQSGGHIAVYSEPGIGSTFRVYLRPAHGAPKAQPEQPDVETLEGTETILVVEDADAVRQLVLEFLEPMGYTVLAAAGGEEALELARGAPRSVDLLLTDVVMPRMNGVELAERLLTQFPAVKVVFTSGYPADMMVRHGIAEEGVAFIQKPYSVDELLLTIRRTLGRRGPSRRAT